MALLVALAIVLACGGVVPAKRPGQDPERSRAGAVIDGTAVDLRRVHVREPLWSVAAPVFVLAGNPPIVARDGLVFFGDAGMEPAYAAVDIRPAKKPAHGYTRPIAGAGRPAATARATSRTIRRFRTTPSSSGWAPRPCTGFRLAPIRRALRGRATNSAR